MSDYFYPEYEIVIGGALITEGVKLVSQMDRKVSFDWMIIAWTEKLIHSVSVRADDEVSLSVGYSGGLKKIFSGYITGIDDLQVTAKNEMLKMNRKKIVNSFQNCTPQDVLTFVLGEAGIGDYELGGDGGPVKKLYNVSNMTAMEVLRDIDRFFGLEESDNIFRNKKFEWNVPANQGRIYDLQYGENIISLECIADKCWELETVLIPDIEILHKVNVRHPNLSGTFEVERLKYSIDENGFTRLKIQFLEG